MNFTGYRRTSGPSGGWVNSLQSGLEGLSDDLEYNHSETSSLTSTNVDQSLDIPNHHHQTHLGTASPFQRQYKQYRVKRRTAHQPTVTPIFFRFINSTYSELCPFSELICWGLFSKPGSPTQASQTGSTKSRPKLTQPRNPIQDVTCNTWASKGKKSQTETNPNSSAPVWQVLDGTFQAQWRELWWSLSTSTREPRKLFSWPWAWPLGLRTIPCYDCPRTTWPISIKETDQSNQGKG